jgi:hypothetical protein
MEAQSKIQSTTSVNLEPTHPSSPSPFANEAHQPVQHEAEGASRTRPLTREEQAPWTHGGAEQDSSDSEASTLGAPKQQMLGKQLVAKSCCIACDLQQHRSLPL